MYHLDSNKVTLYFLNADVAYSHDLLHSFQEALSDKWYLPVLTVPAVELCVDSASDVAKYVLDVTNSKQWHDKLRRSVRPGDVVTYNGMPWIFSQTQDEGDGSLQILPITGWDELHLNIATYDVYGEPWNK